jgi:hypothetical protein
MAIQQGRPAVAFCLASSHFNMSRSHRHCSNNKEEIYTKGDTLMEEALEKGNFSIIYVHKML